MLSLSLDKIKSFIDKNELITMDNIIELYNNYRDCNNFDDLICPLCRNKTLFFHKTYSRNLVYYINKEIHNTKIVIIVCKCKYCTEHDNKQKYHALLPEFILPYNIYEASTIIKSVYDYLNKQKLKDILEKVQITHKLFYDWIKKIIKYCLSSSVILKCNNNIKDVINGIMNNHSTFLKYFYDIYNHPFFLFKLTCVSLCIIP